MSTTRVKQLSTFTGYLQIFYEYCRITKTYEKAWELTENEHFQIFGWNRYSCYDSFRVVKNRIDKNSKNETLLH